MRVFEISVTSIVLFGFSLLLLLAVLQLRSKKAVVFHLTLYTGFGFLLTLSRLIDVAGITTLPNATRQMVIELTLLAMGLSFGALTLNFLNKAQKVLIGYWAGAFIILLFWAVFAFNIWQSPAGEAAIAFNPPFIISILGWIGALVTSFVALGTEFREQHPAKYRNRLRYWLTATVLLSTSGLIRFVNPAIFFWSGLPLILLATILVGYVVLSYHTRDLNLFVGQVLYYVGITGAITAIFYFSLAATVVISRNAPNHIIFLWSVILAFLLAVTAPLVQQLLNQILTRIVFGERLRDEKQVIRYYSQTLSGALDMQRLANTIISLMVETLSIKRGIVFVNQRDGEEPNKLALFPLSSTGAIQLSTGHFATDSPFIDHFRKGQKLLHQYDMDVLPEFSLMRAEERSWLVSTGMELYVPILRHREFVGLLAFGPRSQGTTYPQEDIDLMIALADQSALAMDSARLFERLTATNQEKGSLREQLAGLDQNKADFLSIASHELRTPLTHIHGYARILADFSDEELKNTGQIRTIVEGIVKGSERMKNVVDVMFDVSEVNVGDLSLFLGPVNLESLIDQAVRPYLSALDERRIAFGKSGFEDAPIIEADGTRLMQAFENLISNAIKYTLDGGLIKVSCRAIVEDHIGQAVELVVADNGIGIDPKYHERIFDKFFRVDDTDHHSTGKTKFKGAGPGLGLTLVKGIAEAHGGRVWVESLGYDEVNCPGSKFFFVIPLHPLRQTAEGTQRQSQIETVHWRSSKELKDLREKVARKETD
jgi:signal transduction histidine kinase